MKRGSRDKENQFKHSRNSIEECKKVYVKNGPKGEFLKKSRETVEISRESEEQKVEVSRDASK